MIDQNYGLILPRPFDMKPLVGSSIWTPLSTAHGIVEPILKIYIPSLPTVVKTDALNFALGVYLV